MPGAVSDGTAKRKRQATPQKSKKRAKSTSPDGELSQDGDILLLENEILESKKHYNNITVLLQLASPSGNHGRSLTAAVALCRVFLRLLASGSLTRKPSLSDKEIVIAHWLKSRLIEYKGIILTFLEDDETAPTALSLAMRILKAEGQYLSGKDEYNFPGGFLRDIVRKLVHNGSEDTRREFCEGFLGEYADIRFYTFKALQDILSEDAPDDARARLFDGSFDLLGYFEDVPKSSEKLGSFYIGPPKKKAHPVTSITQQKKQGQDAWLSTLALCQNEVQRKKILKIVTRSIAPWFRKPELLMDFLTDSYNLGGVTSLLALSGVFYLIQERNLDYPSFYRKLYSLLDAEILHSKHRSQFFRLLDTFLGSTHLPAVLVASFIKRLARLCLNATPAAIVCVVPWIYNLFKKHPLCTFMIHRELRAAAEKTALETEGLRDCFDADEDDPMKTGAIDSCLWEVVQLQSHYHPNVATIAKILSEQFTKQSYNLEDFLDHSYSSLLEAELSKQVKKAPVVEYILPKKVFMPQQSNHAGQDGLLVSLWDFH